MNLVDFIFLTANMLKVTILSFMFLNSIKPCILQGNNFNPYSLYLQTSLVAESTMQTNKNCFCVPYWQCKEDFVGLVDDGADIIDIRVYDDEATAEDEENEECTGDFDVCCQVQCGKLGSISNSSLIGDTMAYRILNDANVANVANFGEFPWMLGILQNRVYKCGASLIHPKVAITAAHCVAQGGVFKVRAGEFDWANQEEPLPHQDRLTQKIIIHPHYHAASLSNDLALLILNQEFKLTENVGIVCLPPQSSTNAFKTIDRRQCIASGWGKNSYQNGAYQTTLKKVELPVVPQKQCLHSLRTARLGPHFHLHPSFMCAGGLHNRDTCKGDGGSPLVCPVDEAGEHFQQVGIVSWGLTCGLRNTPGVYVNVAMFVDWIDTQLDGMDLDTDIYKL